MGLQISLHMMTAVVVHSMAAHASGTLCLMPLTKEAGKAAHRPLGQANAARGQLSSYKVVL